ncbi:MAG: hypothetical protein Q9217_006553 [Psora testacea]
MFDTPKKDMRFFEADDSGITHDPHPQSLRSPEDRVFYLMHKATVDCLAGSHMTIATQKFQSALRNRIAAVPVQSESLEMEDLYNFLRPLVSQSTIEAMCGVSFLKSFPEFADDFWMNSNSMPATFWLFWNLVNDRSLLDRVTSEAEACRTTHPTEAPSFDTVKLCNQPLLQSCYAETLRMYVAVYIIRKPVYEDAQVLDYTVPKDSMMVVSSAMAHMDKHNWNTGMLEERPVENFWAERFLTYRSETTRSSSSSSIVKSQIKEGNPKDFLPSTIAPHSKPPEPRYSLNGYNGAWIPFGGGIHQCPGRHWVKSQMLLSFALVNAAFDIELAPGPAKLKVDMGKYGLGALQPAEKVAFKIKRKRNCA